MREGLNNRPACNSVSAFFVLEAGMALHSEGGYYAPYSQVDHALDFDAGRAEAARSAAALYRIAEEQGWTLTCPVTGQEVSKAPSLYGGRLVRKDGGHRGLRPR